MKVIIVEHKLGFPIHADQIPVPQYCSRLNETRGALIRIIVVATMANSVSILENLLNESIEVPPK